MKYVVVKVGYEYDDNWYCCNEAEDYKINSKLFNTMKEAELLANELTIKKGRGINFSHFSLDVYDDQLQCYIASIGGDPYYSIVPETASDDEILEAVKLSGLNFYKVIKIEE